MDRIRRQKSPNRISSYRDETGFDAPRRRYQDFVDDQEAKTKIQRMGVSAYDDDWKRQSQDIPQPSLRAYVASLKSPKEGRGSRVRGWSAVKVRSPRERNELYEKCGPDCFLQPHAETYPYHKFPICPRLGTDQDCRIDPRGVQAAYMRARQYGYSDIAEKAQHLSRHLKSPNYS